MAKLSYKVSYYIFYVLIALILVVLGLFFCVGYNNPVGEHNAPEHTETLLFLMYAMLGVCILVTIIGSLAQFATTLKDKVLYRYFYGYKVKDIAELLEISAKQVENILYRGKEKLRKDLIERGIFHE